MCAFRVKGCNFKDVWHLSSNQLLKLHFLHHARTETAIRSYFCGL